MSAKRYLGVAALLSASGVAFAGYLSFTRMTSGVCAFEEPCPFFLGHPACYTGLALFATALVVSVAALASKVEAAWPLAANAAVAVAGTLFSGRLTIDELAAHSGYRLGLPTCAYGLVFFVVLLAWTIAAWVGRSHRHQLAPR